MFPDEDGWLFLSASQDQVIHLWRLTLNSEGSIDDDTCADDKAPPTSGHVTLIHQCKGHARSVEAIDVSSDSSKVN